MLIFYVKNGDQKYTILTKLPRKRPSHIMVDEHNEMVCQKWANIQVTNLK